MKKILLILASLLSIGTLSITAQPVRLSHGLNLIEYYHNHIKALAAPNLHPYIAGRVATVTQTIKNLAENNQIDDQLVYNLMIEVYNQYNPADFSSLPLFRHWQANQQTNSTCGYHAIANAVALQYILDNNLALTDANIKKFAAYIAAQRPNEKETTDAELCRLASMHGLENVYFVGYNKQRQNIYLVNNHNTIYTLDDLPAAYAKPEWRPRLVNFVCNPTGGHWTLISLIHVSGYQPFMLYLDSLNNMVVKDSPMHKIIEQLYTLFLA